MKKNIVVYSDGTGQDGGARLDARLSNIYKLYRASRIGPDTSIDPNDQISFYDPGLGTDSDSHGLGRIGKTLYKWGASLAGRGIGTNIADCYEFIINHWQPGDRIFLFGFSRGAYTARCVAQVLSLCGVPGHASNDLNTPFKRFGRQARKIAERAVHQVYEHGAGYPRGQFEDERNELARRFRIEFGSDHTGEPNAGTHFIGVFDTVAALGAAGWKRCGLINADWALFAPLQTVDVTFDTNSRVATRKLSASGTNYALTQTSYDTLGRLDCSAVRMNPAEYGSLPASACTLDTQGSFGPDRITQLVYDAAGQVTQNKVAVGTTDAATERVLTYSNNSMLATLKDAENNLTTYEYDGFDRLSKTRFPLPAKGANASSTTDYEQLLSYDANSNPGSRRLRDASSIAFTWDKLDRVTLKNLPGAEPDVTYAWDNFNRITSASQTGNNLTFGWDALSRKTSEAGPLGTTSFGYDLTDRRTSITYPSTTALTINYAYLVTGELDTIKQSTTVLADYGYDNLGFRTSAALGNGAAQAFTYDPVSRLASLTNTLTDTNDLTATFAYNPASQITSTVRTGDMYAWTGHGSGSTAFVSNGLNQQVTIGGATATWDSKGNLTSEPQSAKTYGYSSENLLTSATGGVTLGYDPALRLYQTVSGATTTRFLYDGFDAIAEYNASNALQRRFVFDPTTGQPVLWYEGTGTAATNRRYLGQDERGSVISVSGSTGASLGLNAYDDYGKPGAANLGRYQYTGQKWIGEAGLYDYKFRDYLPHLGIFAQTDPIGYSSGPNLYAYVGGDPINWVDPLGLDKGVQCIGEDCSGGVVITQVRIFGGGTLGGGFIRPSSPSKPKPPAPKPNPKPEAEKTAQQCAIEAAKKNALGLGLDAAGWAANLLLAEGSAAASIAGATIGLTGIGAAAAETDAPAGAIAYAGKQAAVAEGLFAGPASQLARRIGFGALTASTLYDISKAAEDYQNCMKGVG